jgi:pheromone a factor receptor
MMENLNTATIYASAYTVAILSFLCLVIDTPPLIWHARNLNVAAASLILWIIILNLFVFINVLLWPSDAIGTWFSGSILCDIEVKLFIGSRTGQLGALISIMKSLAEVLDTENVRAVNVGKEEKRKKAIEDIILAWGIPAVLMLCHYVVQPTRYAIFAIDGCTTIVDNSWPAIALVEIWPVLFVLVAGSYAGKCWSIFIFHDAKLLTDYTGLVVYRLHRYRSSFSSLLMASSTNKSRFLRLFLMALSTTVVFTPVCLYVFYTNVNIERIPYSWSLVHNQKAWNEIVMAPSNGHVSLDHWIRIVTGIFVFAFFGVGTEAVKMYKSALIAVGLWRFFPEPRRDRVGASTLTESWSGSSLIIKAKSLVSGRRPKTDPEHTVLR